MSGPPETFKLFDDHGSPGSASSGDIPMRRAKRSVSWNDLALSEEAIVPPCLMAPSILRRQESQEKRARSVGPRSAEATWFVRAAGDRVGFDLTDDGTVTQLDAAPPRAASPSSPFSTQQHGSLRLGDRIRSVNGVVVAHRADILAALPGVRAFVLFEVDRELPSPSPSHSSSLSASPPPPERRALGGGGVSRRLSLARKSMPRAQSLPVGLDQMGDGQNHEVGRAQFFRGARAILRRAILSNAVTPPSLRRSSTLSTTSRRSPRSSIPTGSSSKTLPASAATTESSPSTAARSATASRRPTRCATCARAAGSPA